MAAVIRNAKGATDNAAQVVLLTQGYDETTLEGLYELLMATRDNAIAALERFKGMHSEAVKRIEERWISEGYE